MKRGFVTVVTGKKEYYKMAVNLLKSYRFFSKEKYPFAIIAEEENEYTKLFDKTIIFKNPTHTYMDKIYALKNVVYDETIFIEPDFLCYDNIDDLFDSFNEFGEVSTIGDNNIDLNSKNGWFKIEETGKYKDKIKSIINLHSGFIYLKKGEVASKVYDIFYDVWQHFDEYNIGGSKDCLDDKCLSLALAAENCYMHPWELQWICIYPSAKGGGAKPKMQMHLKDLSYLIDGKRLHNVKMCHWGNSYTKRNLYKRECVALDRLIANKSPKTIKWHWYNFNRIFDACARKIRYIKGKLLKIKVINKIWQKIKKRG